MSNGTNSNNMIIGGNLLLVAIGSSVLSTTQYEPNAYIVPTANQQYQELGKAYWGNHGPSTEISQDTDKLHSIKSFAENLLSNVQSLDEDIQKAVNEKFWDMI